MNIILFLLLLITILSFCKSTIMYIRNRAAITRTVEILKNDAQKDDDDKNSSLMNLDSWIIDNSSKLSRTPQSGMDLKWCKELVLEIDLEEEENNDDYNYNDDDEDICDKLGGRLCENVKYSRIDIPPHSKTTFYTSNGSILFPGHSYCLYKQPPVTQSEHHCDSIWGFWVYSPKYERWLCQSRVPGIYNAASNTFDNETLCGKHGQLLFDGNPINIDAQTTFTPDQFYSPAFQERFSCDCPRGYIFDPERSHNSRTTCLKDPCLTGLPPNAAAKGSKGGGKCDCGPYFYNINGDETFPCTSCPSNTPQYDAKNHTLTLFIKCKKKDRDDDFGLIPCETEDEYITGCKKVTLKVKPLPHRETEYAFEDRIFF